MSTETDTIRSNMQCIYVLNSRLKSKTEPIWASYAHGVLTVWTVMTGLTYQWWYYHWGNQANICFAANMKLIWPGIYRVKLFCASYTLWVLTVWTVMTGLTYHRGEPDWCHSQLLTPESPVLVGSSFWPLLLAVCFSCDPFWWRGGEGERTCFDMIRSP